MVYRRLVVTAATLRARLSLFAGLGLQAASVSYANALPPAVASGLGLLAAGLLVYGCAVLAGHKGYSSWVGMVGLLSALGVLIVVMLPPYDALPRPWRHSALPDDNREKRGAEPPEPSP